MHAIQLFQRVCSRIDTKIIILLHPQNGITLIEQQQPTNLMDELDVNNYLVFKKDNEDGPDVKGGHPDALIIHATKVQKISDGKCAASLRTRCVFQRH